jgi:RNA polymerase sigma factor (sigma-70 family)
MDMAIVDPNPTRSSLLQRLKNWEDQESWKSFLQTYCSLIRKLAIRSGLPEADAKDLLQETMLSVAKELPGFQYRRSFGSFRGWLGVIARRRIMDFFRKQHREPAAIHPNDTPGGTDTSALDSLPASSSCPLEDQWEEEWRQAVVGMAVQNVKGRVNPKHFQLFDLYVLRRWPVREVAEAMKVPTAQVYLAKQRISTLIRKEINQVRGRIL